MEPFGIGELLSGMGGGLRRTARNGCATKTGAEFRMLSNLSQAVGAGAEEFEEVEVAEDLELLADSAREGLVGIASGRRKVKSRSL